MSEEKFTKRRTTEQRRAKQAWDDTESVKNGDIKSIDKDEYKTRARQLATMIQINGLGSTMAFLLSKPGKSAYKTVYDHVSNWITEHEQFINTGHKDLMNLIRNEDMLTYRRVTTEAIEYAIWLKRYVEAWEDK